MEATKRQPKPAKEGISVLSSGRTPHKVLNGTLGGPPLIRRLFGLQEAYGFGSVTVCGAAAFLQVPQLLRSFCIVFFGRGQQQDPRLLAVHRDAFTPCVEVRKRYCRLYVSC